MCFEFCYNVGRGTFFRWARVVTFYGCLPFWTWENTVTKWQLTSLSVSSSSASERFQSVLNTWRKLRTEQLLSQMSRDFLKLLSYLPRGNERLKRNGVMWQWKAWCCLSDTMTNRPVRMWLSLSEKEKRNILNVQMETFVWDQH